MAGEDALGEAPDGRDLPFDASDENAVRARKRTAGQRQKRDDEVVRAILTTHDGRAWLNSLLVAAHIFESSFIPDAMSMAFREGERNTGLKLLAQITRVDPDSYVLMMRENPND